MVSPTNILNIVSFTDTVAAGMISPQVPPHAAELGFDFIQIGAVISVYSAFQWISGHVIKNLTDVKGRKSILLSCLALCAISYVYLGIIASIPIFFAFRALLGLFKQTQFLTKALTPDYEKDPKKQSVIYSKFTSLSLLGMAIGPIISGHIMDAYPSNGFTIITIIVGTIFATNTGLIYLLPEIKEENEKKKPKEVATSLSATTLAPKIFGSIENNIKQSINEFYNVNWNIYSDIFLFQLLISLAIGLHFGTLPLFLIIKHEVSSMQLGYITSLQGIIISLTIKFSSHLNNFYKDDKDYAQRTLHLFVTFTVTFIALTIVPNLVMFIVILIPNIICVAVGMVITFQIFTNRSEDSHRATVLGAANSVKSLSDFVIPVVGGVIMQIFGPMCQFYVAACFTTVGIVICYRMKSSEVGVKPKTN